MKRPEVLRYELEAVEFTAKVNPESRLTLKSVIKRACSTVGSRMVFEAMLEA